MSLKEQLNDDMKLYMREKNAVNLGTIRMLKAEIKNAEIEAMKELSDDDIIKVILSSIKKRKDAADIYVKSSRQELADKELAEVEALQKYLPAQLSAEEIKAIVTEVVAELDDAAKSNFGMVMKATMAKVGAGAEGRIVSGIIKEMI